jgi:hypothetical protein
MCADVASTASRVNMAQTSRIVRSFIGARPIDAAIAAPRSANPSSWRERVCPI